jgi:hypothetical protein
MNTCCYEEACHVYSVFRNACISLQYIHLDVLHYVQYLKTYHVYYSVVTALYNVFLFE